MLQRSIPLSLIAVAFSAALPAWADDALPGDAVHGERTYRLACGACHGVGGLGDGVMAPSLKPSPAALRDGSTLYAHTDDELVNLALNNTGMPDGAPVHGFGLTAMDLRDIYTWMKGLTPEPATCFSSATQYIAHRQTIDKFGVDRIQKVLGDDATLSDDDKSVMVYVLYRPADGSTNPTPGHAQKIPEDSSALYDAKPIRKLGYVAYLPITAEGATFTVQMALNRNMRLTVVRPLPSPDEKAERVREHITPLLKAYVGSGGRGDRRAIEAQHGPKAPKEVQTAMLKAFERLYEAATMFDKEENERFWPEPELLKVPFADDGPTPVTTSFDETDSLIAHKKKHR